MQVSLSTTFTPPSIPVWDELSGNLRLGFTTKNQDWNPGPTVVNSTTAIGFWPSLFLEDVRQSHSARYYNPITGRFMSRDPNDGGHLSDPRSLHKYLYASGDPTDRLDPSGRNDTDEFLDFVGFVYTTYAIGYTVWREKNCVFEILDGVGFALNELAAHKKYPMLPSFDLGRCGLLMVEDLLWPFPWPPPPWEW
jgi:RHS repeat-associated protein